MKAFEVCLCYRGEDRRTGFSLRDRKNPIKMCVQRRQQLRDGLGAAYSFAKTG